MQWAGAHFAIAGLFAVSAAAASGCDSSAAAGGGSGGRIGAGGSDASVAAGAGGAVTSGAAGTASFDATAGSGGSDASTPGGVDAGPIDRVPVVQVGPDAYRNWELLPTLRIGTRTYMRSTYDRAGGNEGADASHFLREDDPDHAVTLDVAGGGYLYFFRANHWHGSPWHYDVDGKDLLVQENTTADPTMPVAGSTFLPAAAFPSPVAVTWSTTKGADLSWVPISFRSSFSIAYGRTHYGTGYYIYQLFPAGAENLSRPLTSYALEPADPDIAALLGRAGEDLSPTGSTSRTVSVDVPANGGVDLFRLTGGKTTVRALRIRASKDQAAALASARLRITWDDRSAPSIDAPLSLFFGTGTFYNRSNAEWLVKALLETVHFGTDDIELSSYFPMPFSASAQVELVGDGAPLSSVRAEIRTIPTPESPAPLAYFHATYVDHGTPESGKDLVLLDTTETEGGGDFCGTFNGTSFVFSDRADLGTLEGDPRFFFDDSASPQGYGTGTEEWAGGGDYWGGETMTLPLAGHPVGAVSATAAKNTDDQIESAYRLLVADAMPFGKNARITLEHGGADDSTEHYRSVTYWYGLPGACLERTDTLHVGDAADERAHAYRSPDASGVDSITSRYELGVDHVGAASVIPEATDTGRHTTGTTEFTVRLDPHNAGVLLRRKLDYSYPDQRADVFVAVDDDAGGPFEPAGTWYLAGSNDCVYSNPPGETDPAAPVVETSNRRFRDDEFMLPRKLTENRSSVRLRLVFRPTSRPLYPGAALAEQAWSELRYTVYSWVVPPAP